MKRIKAEMKDAISSIINTLKIKSGVKEIPTLSLSIIGKHYKKLPQREYTFIEDVDILWILKNINPLILKLIEKVLKNIVKNVNDTYPSINIKYKIIGGLEKIYTSKPSLLLHGLVFDINHYKKLSPLLHFTINKSHRLLRGVDPSEIIAPTIGAKEVLYAPLGIFSYCDMIKNKYVINSRWKIVNSYCKFEIIKRRINKNSQFYIELCTHAAIKSFQNTYEILRNGISKNILKEYEFFLNIKKKIRNGKKINKDEIPFIERRTLKFLSMLVENLKPILKYEKYEGDYHETYI